MAFCQLVRLRGFGRSLSGAARASALGSALAALTMIVSCKRDMSEKQAATHDAASALVAACDAPLHCRSFRDAPAALQSILTGAPRVLAVGESHAPRGAVAPSTTRRFREELLPLLAGKTSHLVLELWFGLPQCGAAVKEVAKKQREVTKGQATTNSNDYIALGDAAKALRIQPVPLVPTCEDYGEINDAGGGDIDAMLRLIRRLTEESVKARIAASDKMILAYGGSLHNDLNPRPGMEAWSFGPALANITSDRYVELDLVTPEFIDDSEVWKRLPWFASFHRERQGNEAVLMEVTKQSYVIVFPKWKAP